MNNSFKRTRLLLFTDAFPYPGGEESFLLPEYLMLRQKFDLHIIACCPKSSQAGVLPEYVNEKAKVRQFDTALSLADKINAIKAFFNVFFWREIYNILKNGRQILSGIAYAIYFYAMADKCKRYIIKSGLLETQENVIGYTFWNTYYTMALCMLKKKHNNLSIVSRLHGYDLYNDRVEQGGRQLYKVYMDKLTDKLCFISYDGMQYYKENFAESMTGSDNKYIVSYLGVKASPARNKSVFYRQGIFNIISCSRIIPLKRVELIVQALSEMNEDYNIHWVHFGTGSEEATIKELSEILLGNKPNITYEFKGSVSNREVLNYYSTYPADCFITTSEKEGLPVSIMEALAYGIPIIATDVNGICEAVENEVNGYLLEATPAINSVAKAIQKMCSLPEREAVNMRDAAYSTWSRKFNSDENAVKLVKVIEDLE